MAGARSRPGRWYSKAAGPLARTPVRPLAGRPVMITGAASGIGRSLAQRLSGLGSPVAIADIDEAGLKETARTLPGPVLVRVLDVRDAADQRRFAAEVREWLPSLADRRRWPRCSTTRASRSPRRCSTPTRTTTSGCGRSTSTGWSTAPAPSCPSWSSRTTGVIVNTSSVFGLLGMPYQSAYCASKFAVRGFTDALRQELRGTGVRAVTVHPGGVQTNIARSARVRKDPTGQGRTREQMAAEFEALLRTTPDKAAEIICRGVDRGKARILVGPDAYVFDALARVAPTHYYDVMERLEKRLRAGSR